MTAWLARSSKLFSKELFCEHSGRVCSEIVGVYVGWCARDARARSENVRRIFAKPSRNTDLLAVEGCRVSQFVDPLVQKL